MRQSSSARIVHYPICTIVNWNRGAALTMLRTVARPLPCQEFLCPSARQRSHMGSIERLFMDEVYS